MPGRGPNKFLALWSIAFVILLSTVLLTLPSASQQKQVTAFTDALFTATSASCVTGFIVQVMRGYSSLLGQLVILVLIKIGGLGIRLITILMYVGCIGLLPLIYALFMRKIQPKLNYAEDKIAIG